MASSTSWKLPEGIINLSSAKNWDQAIKEWTRAGVEKLENDEESNSCLCGHFPIRELCFVKNSKTNNSAIVGNHCIEKFNEDSSTTDEFKSVPKIFQSLNRILKDIKVSPNDELIGQAQREGVLSAKDIAFYKTIKGNGNLTKKQRNYKTNLNQRIIDAIASSAKTSFKKLTVDRTRSANPKLIKYALEKKIFTQSNYAFYMKIWMKANNYLTLKQKSYKVSLNNKIVTEISSHFEESSSASSSSSFPTKRKRANEGEEDS